MKTDEIEIFLNDVKEDLRNNIDSQFADSLIKNIIIENEKIINNDLLKF